MTWLLCSSVSSGCRAKTSRPAKKLQMLNVIWQQLCYTAMWSLCPNSHVSMYRATDERTSPSSPFWLKAVWLSLSSPKYLRHRDLMWLQMTVFSSPPPSNSLPAVPIPPSLICLVSLSCLSVSQCDWRLWSDQLSALLRGLRTEREEGCWVFVSKLRVTLLLLRTVCPGYLLSTQ